MNLRTLALLLTLLAAPAAHAANDALLAAQQHMDAGRHLEALQSLGTALAATDGSEDEAIELWRTMAACQWALQQPEGARAALVKLWLEDPEAALPDNAEEGLVALYAQVQQDMDTDAALVLQHTPAKVDPATGVLPVDVALTDPFRRAALVKAVAAFVADGQRGVPKEVLLTEGDVDEQGVRHFHGDLSVPGQAMGSVTSVEYSLVPINAYAEPVPLQDGPDPTMVTVSLLPPPILGWVAMPPQTASASDAPSRKPAGVRPLFRVTAVLAVLTILSLGLAGTAGATAIATALMQSLAAQGRLPFVGSGTVEILGWLALPLVALTGLLVLTSLMLAAAVTAVGTWGAFF